MVSVKRLRLLLPDPIRRFPSDLAAIIALSVASVFIASLPVVRNSVLSVALGVPFVLFAPGYAIVAALFPESGNSEDDDYATTRFLPQSGNGITILERAVFSIGLSVVTVPLLGFALDFSPWGVGPASLLVAISTLTIGAAGVGAVRRWQVSPERRFAIPYDEWYESARTGLLEPTSKVDAALNVVLVVAILVAAGSGAYAVLDSGDDQSFTEFYLLSENETGVLVADGYPTTFEPGQRRTYVIGIGNHKQQPTMYSVVAELQRVRVHNGSATVTESQRVGRFQRRVGVNETVRIRHAISPEMKGEQLRLQYLLYVGEPPPNPTRRNAYRSVHLWVNVTTG